MTLRHFVEHCIHDHRRGLVVYRYAIDIDIASLFDVALIDFRATTDRERERFGVARFEVAGTTLHWLKILPGTETIYGYTAAGMTIAALLFDTRKAKQMTRWAAKAIDRPRFDGLCVSLSLPKTWKYPNK